MRDPSLRDGGWASLGQAPETWHVGALGRRASAWLIVPSAAGPTLLVAAARVAVDRCSVLVFLLPPFLLALVRFLLCECVDFKTCDEQSHVCVMWPAG